MPNLYEIDTTKLDEILDTIQRFSDGREAEKIINETLLSEGATLIKEKIQKLLPASGRTWKKKEASAKSTQPFRHIQEKNLEVTIRSKKAYQYLYFPDDGTNTLNHVGNQKFMYGGAELAKNEIINLIIERMLDKLEEN